MSRRAFSSSELKSAHFSSNLRPRSAKLSVFTRSMTYIRNDDSQVLTKETPMIRRAKAVWRGTGRAGNGHLTSDSGVLAETPYSYKTRFESEKGTNPEELIAAAHAGCFTMALAFRRSKVQGTRG